MPDDRALRVFVSSTFRDMQAERDELVKRVFPLLRQRCQQRGVAWSEVDLRWGVTDEQAAEGDVLPICLAEIERTRPYFIGLLGQRYGWVPGAIDPDLAARFGWLTEDLQRSVTELEILHGVLNNPNADGHAYFYLRDPAWVAALPADQQAVLVDADPTARERLAALRERVRASGLPVADYDTPQALGERLLADFEALIDRLFPATEVPDAAARASAVHAAFGRARFTLHVPRPAPSAALGASASPVLVTGEPGCGASSLVTNWAAEWAAAHASATVVVHHCDADAAAGDFRLLAARLIGAFGGNYDDAVQRLAELPPAGVASVLAQTMRTVSGPALVVLDGVDQLADGNPDDRAPDLRWLPADLATLPVTFVLTGSGERARAAFVHRGWPVLEVPPLTLDERRAIARTVLAAGAKQLDDDNLAALVEAPGTANARFLVTVLDELRQHGDHFTLRALIDRLAAAPSVVELLGLVLERYETDFEGDRSNLVGDAMRAIWAARYGLAEAELLDLLTPGPEQLPQRTWAPLHLAAERHLVSRGGLLGFAHAAMRQAVEQRYLATAEWRSAAHRVLARYFAAEPLGPRVADELGWQYAEAGDASGLRVTLSDLAWAELAYARNPFDLRRLWHRLTPDVADELQTAYAPVLADPAAYDDGQLAWGVSRLLADAGASEAALGVQRHLVDAALADTGLAPERRRRRWASALVNLGANHLTRGEWDDAASAFEQAATVPELEAAASGDLAIVRREQRRWPEAETLFGRADELCRTEGAWYDVQGNLAGWVELRRNQGDWDGAMNLLREQERICRELADPVAVGRALAGQAVVLSDRGRPAEALPLLDSYAEICRTEGDLRGLAEARLNASAARFELGDPSGGDAAAAEAEQLARDLDDPALLARVLVARGSAAVGLGDWQRVQQYAGEAEVAARQADRFTTAAVALGLLGTARREQGDLAGAHAAHTEEAALARQAVDRTEIAAAEAGLGNVAAAAQRWPEALQHYDAALPTLRDLGAVGLLVPVLANRGQIHQLHQRLPQALADFSDAAEAAARAGNHAAAKQWGDPAVQLAYRLGDTGRAERLWPVLAWAARTGEDQRALQLALGEHALLLINRAQANPSAIDRGLLAQAEPLLAEQEAICRAKGDVAGLIQCVGNRAIVQRYTGDLDGALAGLDEQLDLAHRTGNAQGVLMATANRGEVLGLLGRVPEALDALGWARQTAVQYGLTAMVQQLDAMIAGLRAR